MPVTQLVDLKHAQTLLSKRYKNKISVCYSDILQAIGKYQIILDTKTSNFYVNLKVFLAYYENITQDVCPKITNSIHERDIDNDRYKTFDITCNYDLGNIICPIKQQQRIDRLANEKLVKKQTKVKIHRQFCELATSPLTNGHKCISIDFEHFERVQAEILEIGYTIFDDNGVSTSHHLIIKDFLHRKNKTYVPDNRNFFHYGNSETLSLSDACIKLGNVIGDCSALLFHNYRPDCNVLHELLGPSVFDNKTILDTSLMYMKIAKNKSQIKLCNLAKYYGIDTTEVKFHNAGNDAYITTLCLLKMREMWRLLSEETKV